MVIIEVGAVRGASGCATLLTGEVGEADPFLDGNLERQVGGVLSGSWKRFSSRRFVFMPAAKSLDSASGAKSP